MACFPLQTSPWVSENSFLHSRFMGDKATLGIGCIFAIIMMQAAAIAVMAEAMYLLWDSKLIMVAPLTLGAMGLLVGIYGGWCLVNYSISGGLLRR